MKASRLDGGVRLMSPFGPRAVVDPDTLTPEEVSENEPGRAGATSDRAVRDQLVLGVEVDRGEDAAQIGRGAERSPLVVKPVDWLVDRGRDVASAAIGLQTTGGPEPLPLVLGCRAHVHQRGTRPPDGVSDRRQVRMEAPVPLTELVARADPMMDDLGGRQAGCPPGIARAVEDARLAVGVYTQKQKAQPRPVPVEHDRRVRSDS